MAQPYSTIAPSGYDTIVEETEESEDETWTKLASGGFRIYTYEQSLAAVKLLPNIETAPLLQSENRIIQTVACR